MNFITSSIGYNEKRSLQSDKLEADRAFFILVWERCKNVAKGLQKSNIFFIELRYIMQKPQNHFNLEALRGPCRARTYDPQIMSLLL